MINLVILTGITHQIQLSQSNKDIVSKISVITVLLTFIGILCYHTYIQVKDTSLWRKMKQKRMKAISEQELHAVDSIEGIVCPKNMITTTIVERPSTEPLLDESDKIK